MSSKTIRSGRKKHGIRCRGGRDEMSLLPAGPLAVTILLTLSAVLTACVGSPAAPSTDSSSLLSLDSTGRVSSLAPSFAVSTEAGSRFLSSDHVGEVVVLYFSFPG